MHAAEDSAARKSCLSESRSRATAVVLLVTAAMYLCSVMLVSAHFGPASHAQAEEADLRLVSTCRLRKKGHVISRVP